MRFQVHSSRSNALHICVVYLMHLSAPAPSLCNLVPLPGGHGISDLFSGVLEPSAMPCACVDCSSKCFVHTHINVIEDNS